MRRTIGNTDTPLGRTPRAALYKHALEDPPGTSSFTALPAFTYIFNPRMCTENTNLILSVLCLKLFGDVSHSQNETHAPYSTLCDLLPPAPVTSSYLTHTRCPLPSLQQAQLLPPEAIVLVVISEDSSTWLCTKDNGSLHQGHLTNTASLLPITQLFSWFLSYLMPSTSSYMAQRITSNKYLWIKNQELQESEGQKDHS